MFEDPIVLSIIGFVAIAGLTILGKLLWSGFQARLAEAMVSGAFKQVLKDVTVEVHAASAEVKNIRTDLMFIRTVVDDVLKRLSTNDIEVRDVRGRLDATMEAEHERVNDLIRFKHMISDFVSKVNDFMLNHSHTPSPPAPPIPALDK